MPNRLLLVMLLVGQSLVMSGVSLAGDSRDPILSKVSVNGTRAVLTYNELLRTAKPAPSSFTITINGVQQRALATAVSGKTVVLTLRTRAWSDD